MRKRGRREESSKKGWWKLIVGEGWLEGGESKKKRKARDMAIRKRDVE